jgi:hypothetical protein
VGRKTGGRAGVRLTLNTLVGLGRGDHHVADRLERMARTLRSDFR